MTAATGYRIPTRAVCPDHDAPFAFVADLFFERLSDALVLANRTGGKTQDVAVLHLANAFWKGGHETSHIGAIDIQAKRCYAYYLRGLRHPRLGTLAPDPHIRDTEWGHGSRIEILPGTNAQTQGGHPHLVAFDELEQGKRQPYENAKAMPVERLAPDGRHMGQFVATSTRVSGLGLMQRALDEAEEQGTRIYSWCVFESMDGRTCLKHGHGEPLCDGCPLWEWCEGRALAADGWRSRDEILRLYQRSGRDTWEAQHLCRKPDAKALIYAPFTRANVSEEAEYVPGAGPIYVGYDWGFTDPTHIALVQYRDGHFYQFDELSGSQRPERDWVHELVRRVVALPDYEGPTLEQWERIWKRLDPWPKPWPTVWPEIAAGDPSAVQLRAELKEHGISTKSAGKVRHQVEEGQDVMRAAICTAGGLRRFSVHPRCIVTLKALGTYRARELADGSFDPRPDPDPANHAYSHPCDALRYLFWAVRRALGLGGQGGDDDGE